MLVVPEIPTREARFEFRQLAIGIDSGDAGQSVVTRQVVPHAFGFVVEEHEGSPVGPAIGAEGENFSVDLSAVRGSQIDQGSVGHRHVGFAELLIGDLVPAQTLMG